MTAFTLPVTLGPRLRAIQAHWRAIREEATRAREAMTVVRDERTVGEGWRVLPLLPEEEDRDVMPDDLCRRCREHAPRTVAIVGSTPGVRAYAFSWLDPGGVIREHRHSNPRLTAILCLNGGGQSFITVDGERHDFQDGQFTIFDYRRTHAVFNPGPLPRVVLLTLWDIPDGDR